MYKVTIEEIHGKTSIPVVHTGVDIRDGMYGYYSLPSDKKGKISEYEKNEWEFVELGGAVYVRNVITDIDTMKQTLTLYFDGQDGNRRVLKFPREDLNEMKIQNLSSYGVQITKRHADKLIQVIENQEVNAIRVLEHSSLGFSEFDGMSIFKGAEAIGVESTYNGKMRIAPKGEVDIWLEMVENEVIGHTPLETILAIGVAGMLADYLKDDINVENILAHLIGESSTGKTTAALLMVSMGSAPDMMGDNFVFAFTDTLNSLMRAIPSSYPVLIDEGSVLGEKDLTSLLYTLSSGTEKRRLNSNMEVRETSRFRTAITMTSEKSILGACNQNSGLLIRNMEFTNVMWTKDAQSSDKIKSVIKGNYGHVILLVAEFLLKIKKDKVISKFNKEVETVIAELKEKGSYNNLTERTAKQYGLVMLGVAVLRKVLELDFNTGAIRTFLLENSLVTSEEQVSLGIRAIEHIKYYVSKHKTSFITESNSEGITNCRGRLQKTEKTTLKTGEDSVLRLLMSQNDFDHMLREGKFSDSKTVLKELKELGYLVAQKDRYVSKVKLVDKLEVKGYIIQLPTVSEFKTLNREKMRQQSEDDDEDDIDEEISFEDEEESANEESESENEEVLNEKSEEENSNYEVHTTRRFPMKPQKRLLKPRLHEAVEDDEEDMIDSVDEELRIERLHQEIKERCQQIPNKETEECYYD